MDGLIERLAEALPSIAKPPCEPCAQFERCKRFEVACDAFVLYVAGTGWHNAKRDPTREIYESIYDVTPQTHAEKLAKRREYMRRLMAAKRAASLIAEAGNT